MNARLNAGTEQKSTYQKFVESTEPSGLDLSRYTSLMVDPLRTHRKSNTRQASKNSIIGEQSRRLNQTIE